MKMKLFLGTYFFLINVTTGFACNMNNTSRVYYFPFEIETYTSVSKQEIKDKKRFVIKNNDFQDILKSLIPSYTGNLNIRMLVVYEGQEYYINKEGVVWKEDKIIGALDDQVIKDITSRYKLYRWGDCKPLKPLADVLKERHRHRRILDGSLR